MSGEVGFGRQCGALVPRNSSSVILHTIYGTLRGVSGITMALLGVYILVHEPGCARIYRNGPGGHFYFVFVPFLCDVRPQHLWDHTPVMIHGTGQVFRSLWPWLTYGAPGSYHGSHKYFPSFLKMFPRVTKLKFVTDYRRFFFTTAEELFLLKWYSGAS